MMQGINKEYIFKNNQDKEIYLKKINKALENQRVESIAYCIMGNHAHFLMYAQKIEELSRVMQKANQMYAKYFNEKFCRVGSVFRDRFLSEEIDCERYFVKCVNYIYNNPVKAGMVRDKSLYKYSNYNEFIKAENLNYIRKITGINLSKSDFDCDLSKAIFKDIDMDRNEYINDWIGEFCANNEVKLAMLFEDRWELSKMIKVLKNESGIRYTEIMKKFGIARRDMEKLK